MSFHLSVRWPHLSLGFKTVMWLVSQINGQMTRLWMIITTNVSLLPLNALRVVEIIGKVTSIVATCNVFPSEVYQTTWRLWNTQREADGSRSLTFNNGSGHIIVLLHNGRSSLPLRTSQGKVPAPSHRGQPECSSQRRSCSYVPVTGRANHVCVPWGEGTCVTTGKRCQLLIPHCVIWENPNQRKVDMYTLKEMQLWCFF